MNQFYGDLSEAGLAFLTILLFTAGAAGSLWVMQRFLPSLRFERNSSDFGQIYGGAIGTIFALIFALVIIAVWQNYDRVSAQVGQEANALDNLQHSLGACPEPFRGAARARLLAYLDQLVQVEWPRLGKGHEDPETRRRLAALEGMLLSYRPEAPAELPAQRLLLEWVNQNRTLRNDRIKGAAAYLDTSMWISLGLGSAILLLFSAMLNMSSRRQHHLMHGTLGASVGLVFFLLLVYNWPFLGPGALTAAPFQALAEEFRAGE